MGVKRVLYNITRLASNDVSKDKKLSTFKKLQPVKYKDVFILETAVPINSKNTAFIYAGQLMHTEAVNNNKGVSTRPIFGHYGCSSCVCAPVEIKKTNYATYFFNLFQCKEAKCNDVKKVISDYPESLSEEYMVPNGLIISSILYGDANGDGLNDFLLELSDGSGLLITTPPSLAGKK